MQTTTNGSVVTIDKKTWYYPAGGASAIRVEDFTTPANSGVVYVLKDHLGSASVTLNSTGTAVAEMRFYPFGETRVTSGAMPTDQQFTGQRNLGADLGGIYHYNARLYSPKLGRFLSADTIVPEPGNPQALNRYTYVYNNPVNATDPSGHAACYDTGVEIGSGISQADCWAYGRDKWIWGLPVAAPVTGEGYSTERGLVGNLQSAAGSGGGNFSYELYSIYRDGGDAAINWIANMYGIRLPSRVSWKFESKSVGGAAGWNPVKDDELLADLKGKDDNVYIFALAFAYFNFDPAGIVSVLVHEARHAWVEYFRESAGYTANRTGESQAAREFDASNAVLYAIDWGIEISSQGIASQQAYKKSQNCALCPNLLSNNPISLPLYVIFSDRPDLLVSSPYPHCQYIWSFSDCA